jgi:hypothetical protein
MKIRIGLVVAITLINGHVRGVEQHHRVREDVDFEFAAMIVMSDCAPQALPLMLIPPAVSDSAVMVPKAQPCLAKSRLAGKLMVVGLEANLEVPFQLVRVTSGCDLVQGCIIQRFGFGLSHCC